MGLEGREELMGTLEDKAERLIRALAAEAHGRLIRRTPVDKGTARANWMVGVEGPMRTTDPEATGADVADALRAGRTKLLSEFSLGDTVFLTNGLPYIPELERGHSDQAPAGMVGVTVKELQPLASQIAARIGRGVTLEGPG